MFRPQAADVATLEKIGEALQLLAQTAQGEGVAKGFAVLKMLGIDFENEAVRRWLLDRIEKGLSLKKRAIELTFQQTNHMPNTEEVLASYFITFWLDGYAHGVLMRSEGSDDDD